MYYEDIIEEQHIKIQQSIQILFFGKRVDF